MEVSPQPLLLHSWNLPQAFKELILKFVINIINLKKKQIKWYIGFFIKIKIEILLLVVLFKAWRDIKGYLDMEICYVDFHTFYYLFILQF